MGKQELSLLEEMVEDGEKNGLELHEDYPAIIVVICMLAIFSLTGTIGNALVIYVYSRKREKSTTTIFILTLAGTDFFTCLFIIPYTIIVEYVSKRIQYDIACKIYQFLITSNIPFSAFIMVVIAFDRYLKICRPWNHTLDTKLAKRTIILLLIFAAVLGIIVALAHGVPNEVNTDVSGNLSLFNSTRDNINSSKVSLSGNVILRQQTVFEPNTDNTINLINHNLSVINGNSANNRYRGLCIPNEIYISSQVRSVFQKFYASLFLVAFIMVFILYSLVFRSLAVRRSKKVKKRLTNGSNSGSHNTFTTHACTVTTKLTLAENGEVETVQLQEEPSRPICPKPQSLTDKYRSANIKTAGILFIVTIVFIIAFLPAWLMAMRAVGGNIVLFYMHFSYNVANPIIYAFFNQNFRKEMRSVLNCS